MAIVILLAVGGRSVAPKEIVATNFTPVKHDEASDDMAPVDVWLGKANMIHLRIPRAYITALSTESDGSNSSLHISAFLPDMIPRAFFEKQYAERLAKRDPVAIAEYRQDWLLIQVNPNLVFRSDLERMILYAREHYTLTHTDDKKRYRVYLNMPFDKTGSEDYYKFATWEYYIPDDNSFYVYCNGRGTMFYDCHANFLINNNTIQIVSLFKPEHSQFGPEDLIFKPAEMTADEVIDKSEVVVKTVSNFISHDLVE